MAAGLAMLHEINDNPQIYKQLEEICLQITEGIAEGCDDFGINYKINRVGSMFTLFFTDTEVTNFETAKTSDLAFFGKYFQAMLKRGVYLAPSQFESMFISTAISEENIKQIIKANKESLEEILG